MSDDRLTQIAECQGDNILCNTLTYKRLQLSLIFELLLEGSSNPLALVVVNMFTSM